MKKRESKRRDEMRKLRKVKGEKRKETERSNVWRKWRERGEAVMKKGVRGRRVV